MHSIGNEICSKRDAAVLQGVLPQAVLQLISPVLIIAFVFATSLYWIAKPLTAQASGVEVWWPAEGAKVEGTQPFKAMLSGSDVEDYEMFWQVDGDSWNWMDNDYRDYPHKEESVDLSGWNWKGEGPYEVTFIARKDGAVLAERSVTIYNTGAQQEENTSSESQQEEKKKDEKKQEQTSREQRSARLDLSVEAQDEESIEDVKKEEEQPEETLIEEVEDVLEEVPEILVPEGNPLSDSEWYVQEHNPAAKQADAWRNSNPEDAALMDILGAQPVAQWLGGWSGNVASAARSTVEKAHAQNKTALFVAYNIPQRDCGSYSAGGVSHGEYAPWIRSLADGIGSGDAVVILEPDAVAGIGCLSEQDQNRRYQLLSEAITTLKQNPNTDVYLDAGNTSWHAADTIAGMLRKAGIERADGFALNVSNFKPTQENIDYGTQVSRALGGKHFVIDTSRNGQGANGEWCNPQGRGLGQLPTSATGNPLVDAFLWVKMPGESDGSCNGGPNAGTWWPEYALGLIQRARF